MEWLEALVCFVEDISPVGNVIAVLVVTAQMHMIEDVLDVSFAMKKAGKKTLWLFNEIFSCLACGLVVKLSRRCQSVLVVLLSFSCIACLL